MPALVRRGVNPSLSALPSSRVRNKNGQDTLLFPDNGAWRMATTPLGRHFPIQELSGDRGGPSAMLGPPALPCAAGPGAYWLQPRQGMTGTAWQGGGGRWAQQRTGCSGTRSDSSSSTRHNDERAKSSADARAHTRSPGRPRGRDGRTTGAADVDV